MVGYSIFNLFFNQNAFYIFNNLSLFYFIADWSELQLIYSSISIIFITVIIDFIEDLNTINYVNLIKTSILLTVVSFNILPNLVITLFLLLLLNLAYSFLFSNNKNNFTYLIKRITSFSLDSLFNSSLYNSNIKGLNLFISIDNYILETSNYINMYKKISYFFQKKLFNNFIIQINLNLLFVLCFIIFVNIILF